jgi:hypothetical protein
MCLLSHLLFHRACRGRQLDAERHAVTGDTQIFNEPKRDDVSMKIRIFDDRQRAEHRRFSDHT